MRIGVSAVVLHILAVFARADGMLQQLPEDGSWARFEMQQEVVDQEENAKQSQSGWVTISSLGNAIDNKDCRWIEVKFEVQPADKELPPIVYVYKLLIEEKGAKAGENPLDHLVEAWKMGSTAPASRQPNIDTVKLNMAKLFHGPLVDSRKVAGETTETVLGKIVCDGVAGSQVIKHQAARAEDHYSYTTRLHKDAPFGVVTHRSESQRKLDGKPIGDRFVYTLKLSGMGKDATTEIPNAL